jgi:hypothetical protein
MKKWFMGVPLSASLLPWLAPALLDTQSQLGRVLVLFLMGVIPFLGAICVVRYRPPEVALERLWPLGPFGAATVIQLVASVPMAVLEINHHGDTTLEFSNLYSYLDTATLFSLMALPLFALYGGDAVVSRIRADRSARDGHPGVTS